MNGARFEEFEPAYRHSVDSFGRYAERSFEAAEARLAREGDAARGTSSLDWDRARHATRDVWNRLGDSAERAPPGDSDRDAKEAL